MSDVIWTVLWGAMWLAIGTVLGTVFVILRSGWTRRRAARNLSPRHQRIEAIEAERNAELKQPTVPLPRVSATGAVDERPTPEVGSATKRGPRVKPAGR